MYEKKPSAFPWQNKLFHSYDYEWNTRYNISLWTYMCRLYRLSHEWRRIACNLFWPLWCVASAWHISCYLVHTILDFLQHNITYTRFFYFIYLLLPCYRRCGVTATVMQYRNFNVNALRVKTHSWLIITINTV